MSLEMLKRSLSGKLGWLTRTVNSCQELLKQQPFSKELMRSRLEEVKARWEKYEDAYNQLEKYLIEKELSQEFDQMNTGFNKTADDYWVQLRNLEATLEDKNPPSEEGLTTKSLKLPPITLPEFDGESNWNVFWDKFKGLVHDRVVVVVIP